MIATWNRFGCLVAVGCLALWIGAANVCADALEDFQRLRRKCLDQMRAGGYGQAERTALKLKRLAEGPLGDHPQRTANALNMLGAVYCYQARYAEAEPLYKRSLAIWEKGLGPDHPHVANPLNNLAELYRVQGRYAQAEPLFKRSLAIREKALGPDHPNVGDSLINLGKVCRVQGRYAEAEPLFKRSLAIWEKALGPDHPRVAQSLNNLAALYSSQGRCAEGEPLFKRSLAIREKALGPDRPDVAASFNNLANLYTDQGRYAEAEPLYKRSLAMREKALGPDHPHVAASFNNLANLYKDQGRYAEAEKEFKRALEIRKKSLPRHNPELAQSYNDLGSMYVLQTRYAEAQLLLNGAAKLVDLGVCDTLLSASIYRNRAELAWTTDRVDDALGDLWKAWAYVEYQRHLVAPTELEPGLFLSDWIPLLELMVSWQAQLGRTSEVLEAMERGRARHLADQMQVAGMDLLAGLAPDKAKEFRRRQRAALGQVSALKRQLEVFSQRKDLSDGQNLRELTELVAQSLEARREYAQTLAQIRYASPAYRLALRQDKKPISLDKLHQWAVDHQALVLEYLMGTEDGYLLVVPADGQPRVENLTVSESQAESLRIWPGPLTAKRMRAILTNENETGVLDHLGASNDPRRAQKAAAGLAVLWEVLVPEGQREVIVEGKYRRLVVLPDASLAQLPFETLVVEPGQEPKYLLDVAPPIQYAPSATILMNLAERGAADKAAREVPVLTVGNARYGPSGNASDNVLAQLSPRSRYGTAGGRFTPLPYSAWETKWLRKVFTTSGFRVAYLEGDLATERNVRFNCADRWILHLACHGLVDQAWGNLFGALALTPGPKPDDPADDGFLTLAEIYELNLKGCELAILSACETNVGPEQRGEGVWALSRGFLVAGSRRVVASNWLVDDQAAASLVSYFCSIVAKAEKEGKTPDYAEALRDAKRWVRQNTKHEEWKSPYYWGTFVLIGPS